MGKDKQNARPAEPEKRGGLLGFFDTIKNFFIKLITKIREAREYHKRIENGRKDWENTVEGQAQKHAQQIDDAFGYRDAEQIQKDQVHFPGYDTMEVSEGGLMRIPPHTELLWQCPTIEETAKRYLTCIDERFADRPDPNNTRHGKAFNDIAKDMRQAMFKQDGDPHLFVLGNTWISAQVVADKWQFTMSNGEHTVKFTSNDKYAIAADVMVHYAELTRNEKAAVYNDANNRTMFVAVRGDNGYESFTARPVMAYASETKAPMQNVVQLSGPRLPARDVVDAIIPVQEGPASDSNMRELAARAYKGAMAQSDNQTIYIMGDKLLWATQYENQCTVHLAPAQCPYRDVVPVNVPVTEKMFDEEGNIKKTALFYAVQKGMKTLDGRVEAAAKLAVQAERAAEIEKNIDAAAQKPTPDNADKADNMDNTDYADNTDHMNETDNPQFDEDMAI